MQPNDPFQPAPTGIDYLNQIATPGPPPNNKVSLKAKVAIVVLGLIGVLSISMIVVMAGQTNSGPTPLKLAAKLQKIQTVSKDYHKKLRSSQLQDTNSSLTAILTTANQAITTPLQSYEISSKQVQSAASLESSEELTKALDDAYYNFRLDETYIREMGYEIEEAIIMMKSLRKTTKYKSMREYLDKTLVDFENLHIRFVDMGSSGGETEDAGPDESALLSRKLALYN